MHQSQINKVDKLTKQKNLVALHNKMFQNNELTLTTINMLCVKMCVYGVEVSKYTLGLELNLCSLHYEVN